MGEMAMADGGAAARKQIWKVFFILLAITAVEFIFAFALDKSFLRTSIFLVLTIVKAFYIVAEFMHLKHEVKSLIWSIIVPLAFITWFIGAMIYEGGSVLDKHPNTPTITNSK